MNLTAAQRTRLGTFVMVGTGLLVGSLLILGGLKIWETRDTYHVYFTENVAGLEVSAPVRYRGLRLGRVSAMRVAPDNPQAIEVLLDIEPGVPLHEGTVAMLDMSGLTGLKSINLVPGDPRNPVIAPGSTLPGGGSVMNQLTNHAMVVAERLEAIATQLANWTSEDNRHRLEDLLTNLNAFVGTVGVFMDETRAPLGKALDGFAEVARESSGVLRAIRKPVENIDPHALADILSSTKHTLAALESHMTDAHLGDSISSLAQTLHGVNRLLTDFDLVLRSGREDLTLSMKYLRQAAEDVREFSRIIAQDPSVLIRGREMRQ